MNNKPQLVVLPIDKRHSTTSTAKGIRMSVHHLRNSAEFVDEYIVNNGGEKIPGYVDALTQSGIREQKIYATKMVKYINDEIGYHRIINANNYSYSLHFYYPKNHITTFYD